MINDYLPPKKDNMQNMLYAIHLDSVWDWVYTEYEDWEDWIQMFPNEESALNFIKNNRLKNAKVLPQPYIDYSNYIDYFKSEYWENFDK